MARKKFKEALIKNRQAKYLPFLHFENFDKVENKYKIYDTESQKRHEEIKEKKKAKRKKIITTTGFILNLVILSIILIVQLSKSGVENLIAPQIEWKYIGIIALIVFGVIIIDTLKIFIMIKSSTKKSRPFLAYKTSALGRYYDNITPMSTGGQPFQIFYMNKRGIRGDIATGIPLVKYIMWQITYVIICSTVLIFNSIRFGSAANAVVTTVAWIAVIINIAIFSTVVLLSISKRNGPRIVIWILKLLSKMHIIKNYQKTFRKVMRFVKNYQKTFKTLLKNPFVLIIQLVLAFADTIFTNFIPYFICKAFAPDVAGITLLMTFVQSILCSLSLGFIPTPGSSGGAEVVFMSVFAGVLKADKLFWPVLVWRIATYYIYLVQGLLVLVYDFVIGNKKAERLKQKGAEIYNTEEPKTTFKQSLENNRKTIEVVQTQEQDKIPVFVFTGTDMPLNKNNEIIENTNLVSDEEMTETVMSADKLLLEEYLREKERKARRTTKKQGSKRYKRYKRRKK